MQSCFLAQLERESSPNLLLWLADGSHVMDTPADGMHVGDEAILRERG